MAEMARADLAAMTRMAEGEAATARSQVRGPSARRRTIRTAIDSASSASHRTKSWHLRGGQNATREAS